MIKQLKRVGNSCSIVIDKPTADEMGVKVGSLLQLQISGRSLVITPVDDVADDAKVFTALEAGMKKYDKALRNLAK